MIKSKPKVSILHHSQCPAYNKTYKVTQKEMQSTENNTKIAKFRANLKINMAKKLIEKIKWNDKYTH